MNTSIMGYDNYGEPIAYSFSLIGIYLLFRMQFCSYNLIQIFWATFMLGFAVCIRPNILFGVVTFILFSLYYVYQHSGKKWPNLFFGYIGFGMVALPLLHNLFFGDQFVLFTASAYIKQNYSVPICDYFQTILSFLSGVSSPLLPQVSEQLTAWLMIWPNAKNASIIYFTTGLLILTFIAAFVPQKYLGAQSFLIKQCAWSAIMLQLPLLFWMANGRYAMMAWLMTFITAYLFIFTRKESMLWNSK